MRISLLLRSRTGNETFVPVFTSQQEGYVFTSFHDSFSQSRQAVESTYQAALTLLQQDLAVHLPQVALEQQLNSYVSNIRNQSRYLLTVELPGQLNQSIAVLASVGCTSKAD